MTTLPKPTPASGDATPEEPRTGPPFAHLVVLVLVIALGPICIDMYLPALPAMARDFNAGTHMVQLTMSMYLVGFALSQLLYGPAADHFGRKPTLMAGFVILLISTVGCALAQSLPALIAFRLLQALGASAGMVIPRAIVRDLYGPRDSARIFSYMAAAMALAPILAPIAGGVLLKWFSWHAIFWSIAAYGVIVAAGFWLLIPESVPERGGVGFDLQTLLRNKATLLSDNRFLGFLLCITFTTSGMFAYISGSAFVLIDYMHVRPEHFGLLYALPVAGYILGTSTGGRLSQRVSTRRLIVLGICAHVVGSALMLGLGLADLHHPATLIGPQAIYMFGTGFIMPQCFAAAMAPYPRMAGTASSLMGVVQIATSAVVVTILGYFQQGGTVVLGTTMCITTLLTVLTFVLLIAGRPRRN